MRNCIFFSLSFVLVGASFGAMAVGTNQFMATLQLAIDESTPQLTVRSQKLVRDQLAVTFDNWPEFKGHSYEVRTDGREIVFYMMSDDDVRTPMQRAISAMIQGLNGRVRARGRSLFYKTPMTPSSTGYLDVGVNDNHTQIVYTAAQSVPLRQLLKELKSQLGNLSYLIPGECADQLVDWNFGDSGQSRPKTIDAAMGELATLFGLKYEKKNDTHIFSGTCTPQSRPVSRPSLPSLPVPGQFFQTGFLTEPEPPAPTPMVRRELRSPSYHPTVYLPLLPLGD